MSKKKKGKFKNKPKKEKRNSERFVLPAETKQIILGVSMILLAVLISLSFFRKAGEAGEIFMRGGNFLIGESIFIIPLILLLGGLAFLKIKGDRSFFYKEKEVFWSIILALLRKKAIILKLYLQGKILVKIICLNFAVCLVTSRLQWL